MGALHKGRNDNSPRCTPLNRNIRETKILLHYFHRRQSRATFMEHGQFDWLKLISAADCHGSITCTHHAGILGPPRILVCIRKIPSFIRTFSVDHMVTGAAQPFFSAMLVHGLRRAARTAFKPNLVARTLRQTQPRTVPICSQLCK